MSDVLPILTQRRIEAAFSKGVFEEMKSELGEAWAQRILASAAIKMGKRMAVRLGRAALLAAFAAALPAAESSAKAGPAIDFTSGTEAFVAVGSTFGWVFRLDSPLKVGALGMFDVGADGLATGHALGLWTGDGMLLRSAVITTADSLPIPSASSAGNWRVTPVPLLTLTPGIYVLGATFVDGDPDHLIENATIATIPGITFAIARLASGPGLLFPTTDEPGVVPGYFGPNLFAITVPEPASPLLLGAAAIWIAGRIGGARDDKLLDWRRARRG